MKKILLSLVALAAMSATTAAVAQTMAVPADLYPYTTVKVYVTVEKETVRTGPYARYAQKYFGTMAPLANKEIYTVKSARIDYAGPDRKPQTTAGQPCAGVKVMSHIDGEGEFTRSAPDRMLDRDKTTEEMARDAANTIFSIRRQRIDVLTSDAGDYYQGGLEAALDEMKRVENEYLALFLGKHSVSVETHEIEVIPVADKTNYIVCRFTEDAGLLPDNDLSGEPLVLTIAPERSFPNTAAQKNDKKQTVQYRLPDIADCRLSLGQKQIASKRMPIYQFGTNVAGADVQR